MVLYCMHMVSYLNVISLNTEIETSIQFCMSCDDWVHSLYFDSKMRDGVYYHLLTFKGEIGMVHVKSIGCNWHLAPHPESLQTCLKC